MSATSSVAIPDNVSSVAVITVCRNALAALQMTSASVQDQRWPDLQHVVVDGASTDGSQAFLREHATDFAVAVSERDSGIYDAMNKAVALCPPVDWLIFLNAGDRFVDEMVLSRLSGLLAMPVDFVFGDVAIRNASFHPLIVKARPHACLEMPGCHQSMLVRANVMRDLRFDTSYQVGGDFEFFLRATQKTHSVAFHDGAIAEIAPEGFSAANESVLQRDYARALTCHRGHAQAGLWLLRRRLVRGLRKLIARIHPAAA